MKIDIEDGAVTETWETPGQPPHLRTIPLTAVASYGALLGLNNPSDVVEAINEIREHVIADPTLDTPDTWADTLHVLSEGTPERAEHRAEVQASKGTPGGQNSGQGNGPGANSGNIGKGQLTAPGQLAKAARQAEISAAQTKLRGKWKIAPPGQLKKDPALAQLDTPTLVTAVNQMREEWLESITTPSPDD
ncbi:MAG: hypothetical protein FWF25_06230 [Propionibacteriaceae bacterium]|nr:hypothetical protein [Propionibacteriaceae bacterium]